jgi:hypothetical protein
MAQNITAVSALTGINKENTLESRSTLTLESVADERQYRKVIYQEKSERISANQPLGMEF